MTDWGWGRWVSFLWTVVSALMFVLACHAGIYMFVVWLGDVVGLWEVPSWMM